VAGVPLRVRAEAAEAAAGANVPHHDVGVTPGRGKKAAIVRKGQRVNGVTVALHGG